MPISLGLSHKTLSLLALMFKTVRFSGEAAGAEIKKEYRLARNQCSYIDHMYSICILLLSPSSKVLLAMATLNGPGPTLVCALTLIEYSTYSSSPPSSTASTEPLVVLSVMEGISLNVLWLTSTSYWLMTPFLSISGTGSHITVMTVEESVRTCTWSGGAFGPTAMREPHCVTSQKKLGKK